MILTQVLILIVGIAFICREFGPELLPVVVSYFPASTDPDSEYSINVGSWDQSVLLSVVVSDSHAIVEPDSEYSVYMLGVGIGVVVGCRE